MTLDAPPDERTPCEGCPRPFRLEHRGLVALRAELRRPRPSFTVIDEILAELEPAIAAAQTIVDRHLENQAHSHSRELESVRAGEPPLPLWDGVRTW